MRLESKHEDREMSEDNIDEPETKKTFWGSITFNDVVNASYTVSRSMMILVLSLGVAGILIRKVLSQDPTTLNIINYLN